MPEGLSNKKSLLHNCKRDCIFLQFANWQLLTVFSIHPFRPYQVRHGYVVLLLLVCRLLHILLLTTYLQ